MAHVTVLRDELIAIVVTDPEGTYIDATLGDGGHSERLLELFPKAKLIGIDVDDTAISIATQNLKKFGRRATIFRGNFANIEKIIREDAKAFEVQGIMFDLGLRTEMLEDPFRGFSYKLEGPLDMRFDRSALKSAFEVINKYPKVKLAELLHTNADVDDANKIAAAILQSRTISPITTTSQLAKVIGEIIPSHKLTDCLTKVFMALRMEVNDEIGKLETSLSQSLSLLELGGRLAIITFHSKEDATVKEFFAREAKDCLCPPALPVCRCGHRKTVTVLTKKAIVPSADEIAANRKARSAKLRAAEKIA